MCVCFCGYGEFPEINCIIIIDNIFKCLIWFQVPSLFSVLPGSEVDFNFKSTLDKYAAKSQNYYTMLTAGKMLGGSASLNHFIHLRGTSEDYDCWAELSTDNSWKYKHVLPYFIKSERVDDSEIISAYSEFHGTKGPMGLTREPHDEKVGKYMKSFAEVGEPTVLDLNAGVKLGYTQPQVMIADKVRQTPGVSYLKLVKDKTNLYVSKNTRVTKIIFDNKVAVAVEAVYKGKTFILRAKKEIIISAGVYNSPQLLMLSGVGPREHLQSFNIDVICDLPVGDNLVDQVAVTLVYKLKKYPIAFPDIHAIPTDPTVIPFPVFVGSVALNKSQTCPDYQTFNLLFAHDTPFLTVACSAVFGLKNEICDRWQKQVISRDVLYNFLALLQPKSTGTVRLRSVNPFHDSVITTGYYTNKEDLETMLKIVKDFIRVGGTKYFKEIGAELAGLDDPACADKEKYSNEFWICYILNHSSSPYHPVGTCPMGKVVDGKLKVNGIKNLRVIDASVMPKIPRSAPNAAVVMLAEKGADMIKCDDGS